LEHFLDQQQALREIKRVLKPGKKVLILVPNSGFLTYRFGLYKGTNQASVRETIRSLKEWSEMFNDAGLKIIDRWKDLHILNLQWLLRKPMYLIPARLVQALSLISWPLSWQYQVYYLCE
jgi:SAM-dependent methyltransferase